MKTVPFSPLLLALPQFILYPHLICCSNFQLALCRAIAGNSPSGQSRYLPLNCRIMKVRYLEPNIVGHLSRESPMVACSTPFISPIHLTMIGSCHILARGVAYAATAYPQNPEARSSLNAMLETSSQIFYLVGGVRATLQLLPRSSPSHWLHIAGLFPLCSRSMCYTSVTAFDICGVSYELGQSFARSWAAINIQKLDISS